MKFIYPAIIRKTESGYQASCPDLSCCEVSGETLEETVDMANEAVYDWIYLELSEGGILPPVSDERDLELKEGETVRNICVNIRLTDGYDE